MYTDTQNAKRSNANANCTEVEVDHQVINIQCNKVEVVPVIWFYKTMATTYAREQR